MSFTLRMLPNVAPMSWNDFNAGYPPFSIALDGFVAGPPMLDRQGPRANLNHHEGVDRAATRATCSQTRLKIQLGLFDLFRDEHGPRAEACVNDCDEDVCLSVFCLADHQLAADVSNWRLNRLERVVDLLDSTAGCFPFPTDFEFLEEVDWIFDPYRVARIGGLIDADPMTGEKDVGRHVGVIETVGHRIRAYLDGRGERLKTRGSYLTIPFKLPFDPKGWKMFHESGANGRRKAFADGIRAYVIVRELINGRFAYTVGRVSEYVPFDVPLILKRLDSFERAPGAHWGGGDLVGGSPRIAGSALAPEEVAEIIDKVLRETA